MKFFKAIATFFNRAFRFIGSSLILAAGVIVSGLKSISFEGTIRLFRKLPNLNIYRRLREKLIKHYIRKAVSFAEGEVLISWQPLLWILIKVGVIAFLSYRIYLFHPQVAEWLKIGLNFFRLHEIYNFTFPDNPFFLKIARYLFLFVLGYHGLYFLYHQIQALFSSIIIHKKEKRIYYIRNSIIKRSLYIFSIPEIDLVVMGQNILFRLFRMGNITLYKKSGEKVVIASLKKAPMLIKTISELKSVNSREMQAED